jgi:hypothetical protein
VANKYLRQTLSSHTVEQDVEWLFALDVHANAFLCSFMLTHVLQVRVYYILAYCTHSTHQRHLYLIMIVVLPIARTDE